MPGTRIAADSADVGALFAAWGNPAAGRGADPSLGDDDEPCVLCPSCGFEVPRIAYPPGRITNASVEVCAFCVPADATPDIQRGDRLVIVTKRGKRQWQIRYADVDRRPQSS